MKKIKILPSILMLIACIAVLGVGVFAVAPTQNKINGSITINASNPEIIISVYSYGQDGNLNSSPFFGPQNVRSGVEIPFGTLEFDLSKANSQSDLENLGIKFVIRIENPTSTELGAYFTDEFLTEPIETKQLTTADSQTDVVSASLSKYTKLNPATSETEYGSCDMEITFKLLKFSSSSTTVNLIDDENKIYLNIGAFDSKFMPTTQGLMLNYSEQQLVTKQVVSNESSMPTVIAGDKGYELQPGLYLALTNLTYTNSSTVALISGTEGSFSFNLELCGEAYSDFNVETLINERALFIIAGTQSSAYDAYVTLNSGTLALLTEGVSISGSTITIVESALSAYDGKFCLLYINAGDLELSFETLSFNANQTLSVDVKGEPITTYDKVVNNGNTDSMQQEFTASEDNSIDKNIGISGLYINQTPDEVQSISINTNVTQGDMYLIDTAYYATLSSSSISEIISVIQAGAVNGKYVSEGVVSEDGKGTTFEIPNIYLTSGNLKLTAIMLSESENQKVTYALNYLDQINNWLIYSLVKDDTNGNYYSVAGAISNTITEVSIPATRNNLPVKAIADNAFKSYSSLTSIDLSKAINLKTLGSSAFYDCKNVTNIEYNAVAVDDLVENNYIFYNVGNAKNGITLNIGTSVTKIPAYLFYPYKNNGSYSPKITEMYFADGSICESIGAYAFAYLNISNITMPEKLKVINKGAFSNCLNLNSIKISSDLTNIGVQAFMLCERLISIEIPSSVTSIGGGAFTYCRSLKSVKYETSGEGYNYKDGTLTIISALTTDTQTNWYNANINPLILNVEWEQTAKENTTIIPKNAFDSCYNLTSIEIPSGVANIGQVAFSNCQSLTGIEIPSGVTSIRQATFSNCVSLKSIKYETSGEGYTFKDGTLTITTALTLDTKTNWYIAYINPLILNVEWEDTAKTNTTIIPKYAFQDCYNLTEIEIPSGVISVGDRAFWNCFNITNVIIPSSVTSIVSDAFSNCIGLNSITIKSGVDLESAYTLPSVYKEGYTFNGWYTTTNTSGTKVTVISANKYTSDTTYYTVWTAE